MKKAAALLAFLSIWLIMAPTAYADYDYFTFSCATDPTSLPASGGTVVISATVDHALNSAYAMSDVQLYYSGSRVVSFGDIYAGQKVTQSGTIQVDSAHSGGIAVELRWKEDGQTQRSKSFNVSFSTSSDKPALDFVRNVSKTSGKPGDQITLTYTVNNTGKLHVSDVTITDEACGTVDSVSLLKTGQSFTTTFIKQIGSGFTSKPKVTYKSGSSVYNLELDPLEITSGEPAIDMKVESSKSVVAPGEEFNIMFTVTNTGTAPFTSVLLTESERGEILSGGDLAAGESKTFTYKTTIDQTTAFEFLAAGGNETEEEWIDSANLQVQVDPNRVPLDLEIDATSSSLQLEVPGMVEFDITLTNTGSAGISNVSVYDYNGTLIQNIGMLQPGSTSLQWSVNVQNTTSYTFKAAVNIGGSELSVASSPVRVEVLYPDGASQPSGSPDEAASGGIEKNIELIRIALIIGAILLAIIILALIFGAKASRRRSRH